MAIKYFIGIIVYPARKGALSQGFWVREWRHLKQICYTRVFDNN